MFTGLVQAVGRVEPCPLGVWVHGDLAGLGTLGLGDSIAVDGVCLTVAERQAAGGGFRADVSEETLSRTTLGRRARAHALVNLEPALRLSDRLGGHLVSGHVDGTGTVVSIEPLASSWRMTVAWEDPSFGRYVCDKASIAIDGISLTVAGCQDAGAVFWLAVIPHTWNNTTLCQRRVGDVVNLEADLVARYLERLLAQPLAGQGAVPASPLTSHWLAEHGWSSGDLST
ncbi:MAG: riboflavin synthase [Cyanobacteriota bacterium]|nr:riboflavin synthase [Cyanobacteriota bacterium]